MDQRFQLLPEWAEQQAVVIAWPHAGTDWKPWLAAIERDYVALTTAIAAAVTPIILCPDQDHKIRIKESLRDVCRHEPRVECLRYNDTWCRDFGPLTVADGDRRQLLDFRFNGWGSKYAAADDDAINRELAHLFRAPMVSLDFELEGGSVETDGQGTLLTTRECLLRGNRNAGRSGKDIEAVLLETLGLKRCLWLDHGRLAGDDTDSHIDNLARFCDASTIAFSICTDRTDPHFGELAAMEQELKKFCRPDGKAYELVPIPIPSPRLDETGGRLPASYVNFLILNDRVIVPVFDCSEDDQALDCLQICFPDKVLVPVPGNNLIRQFGGPHCATMQLPRGIGLKHLDNELESKRGKGQHAARCSDSAKILGR